MECSLDFCDRRSTARGYCDAHYRASREERELAPIQQQINWNGQPCQVEGCERNVKALGYCRAHYTQMRATGETRAIKPRVANGPTHIRICKFDDCGRKSCAYGYCQTHDAQVKAGRELVAIRERNRGWIINGGGYVVRNTRVNGRQIGILQHREVMEGMIGRQLIKGENVHHINGVRHDNRPENLELWSTSQPSGQRVADKLAWADEMIALYRPSLLAASQLALVA
jgi:hypothetical protein